MGCCAAYQDACLSIRLCMCVRPTSGASHLGLFASRDAIEDPGDEVCTMRLRLKSVTLTRQWRSTSMLGDFRSR